MNNGEKYLLEEYNYKQSKNRGVKVFSLCIIFFTILMIVMIINRRTYWWIFLYIIVLFFIIEIIMYVSTNLNYYDMRHPHLIYGTTIDTCDLRKDMYVPDTREYEDKVSMGYEIVKEKSIVILCLARDVEANVEMARNKLESIGREFYEYKIVLFENDSDDESRKYLKNWVMSNENVDLMDCCNMGSCECLLNNQKGYNMGGYSYNKNRISKMRYYRETLLRYAVDKYYDYDYVMIYDFDISGVIYKDGVMTSFSSDKEWDMVFANGLQSLPMITFNTLKLYDHLPYLSDDMDYDHKLSLSQLEKAHTKLGKYKIGDGLVKCKSGFNGMAIYRMECLLESTYMNTERYCEHVDLHNDMYKKGYDKVYYNPSMVLFAGQVGDDRTNLLNIEEVRRYKMKLN